MQFSRQSKLTQIIASKTYTHREIKYTYCFFIVIVFVYRNEMNYYLLF